MSVIAKHHHNQKSKLLTFVSCCILKHPAFDFNIDFKTKQGQIYILLYSKKWY